MTAQGAIFVLHHIPAKRLFGLKTLWRGSAKVAISDPARTLIDMIAAPETGGGIDHVAECLSTYLGSKTADRDLLIRYAEQFGNGASSSASAFSRRPGFMTRNSPLPAAPG